MDATAMLLNALLHGGNGAVVALLIFICYGLWLDRTRLLQQQDEARKRLDAVALAQAQSTDRIVNAITDARITRFEDMR